MAFLTDEQIERHSRRILNMARRGDPEFEILFYKWDLVITIVQAIACADEGVEASELRAQAEKAREIIRLRQ